MTDTTPAVRIVPVEPTEAMMKAADAVDWSNEDERCSVINMWQCMLAAAPVANGGEGEDFGDALLAFLFKHGLMVALDVSEIEALRLTALRARSSPDLSGGGEEEISPIVKRLAYGYAIMHTAICHMAGTSGASPRWYYDKANEAFSRVSPIHAITETSNPHVNGDYFSGLSDFLAALSPSREGVEPEAGAVDMLREATGHIAWMRKFVPCVIDVTDERLDEIDDFLAATPNITAHPTPADDRLAVAVEALKLADQHIQHMATWITRTNASDVPLHGYSFESLGEDKWIIDQALALLTKSGEAEG